MHFHIAKPLAAQARQSLDQFGVVFFGWIEEGVLWSPAAGIFEVSKMSRILAHPAINAIQLQVW
ncbi:MAG: hypothetical protein ABI619_05550 [Betaproteobacteria bacterium]